MRIAQSSAASNTGRKRRHNEDAYVCEPPIFAVADGMGGARAGEVASALAASALRDTSLDPTQSAERGIVALIQAANMRVHERALSDSAASGMGTTITVALFEPEGSVVIGHVGDSRAYVLRDGELEQLTEDHSLVAELVRRGELSPEQAEVHPQRSVITRALGTEPDVDVDATTVATRNGDVFLLCSDGLTTMVDSGAIAELLQSNRFDLAAAGRALIRAANDRGGEDNITTVLFSVSSDEPAAGAEPERQAGGQSFEDEDTLHPEDEVAVPALAGSFSSDTVIGMPAVSPDAPSAEGETPAQEAAAPVSRARLLAAWLLVVVLLVAIVVLVGRGFPL
jgi:serine/threonine protein phosphatase PrpC